MNKRITNGLRVNDDKKVTTLYDTYIEILYKIK